MAIVVIAVLQKMNAKCAVIFAAEQSNNVELTFYDIV